MRTLSVALPVLMILTSAAAAQPTAPVTPGKSPPANVGKKQLAKEAPLLIDAREAVKRTLKDPISAVFQNVQSISTVNLKGQPMQVVCGEVNAKNSYGGFTGFTRWIYDVDTRSAFVMGGRDDIVAAAMVKNFCP